MYNHFVCQLSDTRLMEATSGKYKAQLNSINKQHRLHYPAVTSWREL